MGTLIRESKPPVRSTTQSAGSSGRMQVIAWWLVGAAALVIVLGLVATIALIRAASSDIPTVSDIRSVITDDIVEFTWADPGLRSTDSYRITTNDGEPAVQQRDASFVVDADPGDRVCISVAVNREGKTGPESSQKCADIPG